jgi:ectoine hydroxylase-related dioxygenase (phytanoyl-CoA dioxygenase family)
VTSFEQDGYLHFSRALDEHDLARIEEIAAVEGPGVRLTATSLHPISDLLDARGRVGSIVAELLGNAAFPVRAIMFDKNSAANWSLGWHQDRTICVAERIEVEGFGPWTVKQGQLHTQPPQNLLDRMITVRIHLDDVPAHNGPLLVIKGSHRLGRLTEVKVADLVVERDFTTHLAQRGDIWVYRTPIVHASASAASGHAARRVLQLDYSSDSLPGGLRWAFGASALT